MLFHPQFAVLGQSGHFEFVVATNGTLTGLEMEGEAAESYTLSV